MRDSSWRRFVAPVGLLSAALLVLFAGSVRADQPVVVTTAISGNSVPGGTVNVTATYQINDGSSFQSITWAQVGGVEADLSGANTATVSVALPARGSFKTELLSVLADPPIGTDELPANVELPFSAPPLVFPDRLMVVGISPFALDAAGLVELQATVVTSLGSFVGTADIHVELPWRPTSGVHTVPVGVPVLLNGRSQASYDWALTSVPGGSGATLVQATTQNPELTPDVAGVYEVTVTDGPVERTLELHAGTWEGAITGMDNDGTPTTSCTGCHNGGTAPDRFTDWASTGHATVFSRNLDDNGDYATSCLGCHTVGFDPQAANSGFDDVTGYAGFSGSGLLGAPGDNWSAVLADYPQVAQRANVQCESCHGPNQGGAHTGGAARMSLSSDVCAVCHGGSDRHGRFQQWQLSRHANYLRAEEVGQSGNCARCHTSNGFVAWTEVLLDDDPGTDPTADLTVTWTTDETHPLTCTGCHDPHATGSGSGATTDATLRISGSTPQLVAGFAVTNVGKGALCMACHNSRQGLRNDDTFSQVAGTSEAARAPHYSAQADVLMGQNAYFTEVGSVAPHGTRIADTCVACHMEATPAPDLASYEKGGTNHAWTVRRAVCSSCHGDAVSVEDVQATVAARMDELKEAIEQGILDVMQEQIDAGNTIDLAGDVVVDDVSAISALEFGDYRARHAIIVTLSEGGTLGPYRMTDVDVVNPAGPRFDLYSVASPVLIKAGWNYLLFFMDGSLGAHNPEWTTAVLEDSIALLETSGETCVEDADTMCLNGGRFKVEVSWRTAQGGAGSGQVASCGTDDSGLFYFFNPSNWEMLVKVLDGCGINDRYWVFYAATTNVEFTITVTDTEAGLTKSYNSQTYTNPLGQAANAVTDTGAFATCP